MEKKSKMYENYMAVQKEYPDCIVLYRLGDFYEVMGENAKIVAEKLGLTLLGRDCGLEERVPMCGFPYHTRDEYVSELVRAGYKIAIIGHEKAMFIPATSKES